MYFWYKNSFLASIVSMFGGACIVTAIGSFAAGPGPAILMILLGIVLMAWGKSISDDKAFKTWWKQIEDNNLQPQIAQSAQFALEVYNKNPQERTLKKIAELNPSAAEQIRAALAAKKSK